MSRNVFTMVDGMPTTLIVLFCLISVTAVGQQAFFYDGSSFQLWQLGTPLGLNDAGGISGVVYNQGQGVVGFLYDNGSVTTIKAPGAQRTEGFHLNNEMQVVGSAEGYSQPPHTRGFISESGMLSYVSPPGSMSTELWGINDSGQIVGTYAPLGSNFLQGFLYDNGSFMPINVPGSINTYPYDINNSGEIVGEYSTPSGSTYGFIYFNGIYTTIDIAGSNAVQPIGLNNLGQVVGYYAVQLGNGTIDVYGFLYSDGVVETISGPGNKPGNTQFTRIYDINDSGQMVGDSGTPEASSILLLGSGVLGLASFLRATRRNCGSQVN